MSKIKVFDGFLESLYKKWELYLFRLFQLARFIESNLKITQISAPDISEILNPLGCTKSLIRIPPNPFWIREDDRKVFLMFYSLFECRSMKEKDLRKLLGDVWERIGEIKKFVGITKNTQYIGEPDAEKRLVNEIDVYIKYPEALTPLHKIVLGDNKNIELLRSFQRFLKDREPVRGIISTSQY